MLIIYFSVPKTCPRLLINLEKVGMSEDLMSALLGGGGLMFDSPKNRRDVALISNCDSGCIELVEKLGWKVSKIQII